MIKVLGTQEMTSFLEPIIATLNHHAWHFREDAAETLGLLGQQTAIKPLIEVVDDKDSRIRKAVIQALGRLGGDVPAEFFVVALGDSAAQVREAALTALQRNYPDVLYSLLPDTMKTLQSQEVGAIFTPLLQGFIAEISGYLHSASPRLLEVLTRALEAPYWETKMNACQALGKLRRNIPYHTIRRLLELRQNAQSRTVRDAADDALAEILSLETGIEDDGPEEEGDSRTVFLYI